VRGLGNHTSSAQAILAARAPPNAAQAVADPPRTSPLSPAPPPTPRTPRPSPTDVYLPAVDSDKALIARVNVTEKLAAGEGGRRQGGGREAGVAQGRLPPTGEQPAARGSAARPACAPLPAQPRSKPHSPTPSAPAPPTSTGAECYLQSALLYTSTDGARRIRVSTLALPVTDAMGAVFKGADLDAQLSAMARQVGAAAAAGRAPRALVPPACVPARPRRAPLTAPRRRPARRARRAPSSPPPGRHHAAGRHVCGRQGRGDVALHRDARGLPQVLRHQQQRGAGAGEPGRGRGCGVGVPSFGWGGQAGRPSSPHHPLLASPSQRNSIPPHLLCSSSCPRRSSCCRCTRSRSSSPPRCAPTCAPTSAACGSARRCRWGRRASWGCCTAASSRCTGARARGGCGAGGPARAGPGACAPAACALRRGSCHFLTAPAARPTTAARPQARRGRPATRRRPARPARAQQRGSRGGGRVRAGERQRAAGVRGPGRGAGAGAGAWGSGPGAARYHWSGGRF
jgi:hypothetical protein